MYKCHLLADLRYYPKSRSSVVRLVSCLPKSNKGMKDDFLIVSGHYTTVFTTQSGRESQVRYPRFMSFFFNIGISPVVLLLSPFL